MSAPTHHRHQRLISLIVPQSLRQHLRDSLDSWLWLWRNYLRQHVRRFLAAVFLLAIEGAMLGFLSWIVRPMFDQVFVAGNRGAVVWVAAAVLSIFLVRAAAGFGNRALMTSLTQRVTASLRANILRHMLKLDSAFFQKRSPGKLSELVRGDTEILSGKLPLLFSTIGRDVVALIALFTVAISIDLIWTAIAVAAVPALLWPVKRLHRKVAKRTKLARNAAETLAERLNEILHGIDTIKLNNIERHRSRRYSDDLDRYVREEVQSELGRAGIPAITDIVAGIGFFGVLIYGGLQIIGGEKTIGEFMSFFTAIGLVFEPLRRVGNVSGQWVTANISLRRLRDAFDERPTIVTPASPTELAVAAEAADVALEDVDFSYSDQPVLRGATFRAEAGKTTALVGVSGAGKSTVFRILTRLADPQAGRATIGGTDVKQLDLPSLRRMFSVVTQDAHLFDESIRDNIVLDRDSPHLDEIMDAAHISEFVGRMTDGVGTRVGTRGSELSGGQRQRVAIARALHRNTPILLLDEATSALDAQSEALIQEALERLSAGRTTLVIAHRLATIRSADKIVVMDEGRVVDEGTHDELIGRDGIYAHLYWLQFEKRG